MDKSGWIFFWLSLTTIGLSACKKSETAQPAAPPPQPSPVQVELKAPEKIAAPTNPPVRLQVSWPSGSRYVYRLELMQHSTNRLGEKAEPSVEQLTLGLTYSLEARTTNSPAPTELTAEFLAYDMEIWLGDQVVIHFDTVNQGGNETNNPVPGPFRRMIGSKLQLMADSTGRVESVIGLAEWSKAMVGTATGPAVEMFSQQFNEGFIKQMADFGRGLPAQSVVLGESWPYRSEVPAGSLGSILVESTLVFSGWADREQSRFAVVEAKGTLKTGTAPTGSLPGAIHLEQGAVQSTSWFDPKLGLLVESIVEQSMHLAGVAVPEQGSDDKPRPFTADIGQKVTVKLAEWTDGTKKP